MNETTTVALSLPVEAVQLVLAGLNQLPHGQVAGLYQHIVQETNRQIEPPKETNDAND